MRIELTEITGVSWKATAALLLQILLLMQLDGTQMCHGVKVVFLFFSELAFFKSFDELSHLDEEPNHTKLPRKQVTTGSLIYGPQDAIYFAPNGKA